MNKPHRHAELIHAYADGAEIEVYDKKFEKWTATENPCFLSGMEYRIKPEPKPDLIYYGVFDMDGRMSIDSCFTKNNDDGDQIKLTFDGETGKLKSAEVL